MAGIEFGGEEKASDAPVGLSVKRSKKRSGKRWGADLNDASTAPPSGAAEREALAGNVEQAAAADPNLQQGEPQPVQKSRKPKHKRWGPDKDAPDAVAVTQNTEEPAQGTPLQADPEATLASSALQQKLKRKRWGPDAPEPEQVHADAEAKHAAMAQPKAAAPDQHKRKRWGPEEPQAPASAPAPEPAEQDPVASNALEGEAKDGRALKKTAKKRRWGHDEPAESTAAPPAPAPSAPPAAKASTKFLSMQAPCSGLLHSLWEDCL